MPKTDVLLLLYLGILHLVYLAGASPAVADDLPGQSPEAPPNIVLILSDDQDWHDYGFMGSKVVETPHLDQLARRSLVFERGYVVTALCRPSLASIVTGLYPHQHGVVGNDVSPATKLDRHRENQPVVDAFHRHPSWIRSLVAQGYLAFQSGKWWEGSWQEGGFTGGMTHGDPTRGGRHGDEGLLIGRQGMAPVTEFIDNAVAAKKPFCLWYAPFLPHAPHNPPAKILEKYTAAGRPENVASASPSLRTGVGLIGVFRDPPCNTEVPHEQEVYCTPHG